MSVTRSELVAHLEASALSASAWGTREALTLEELPEHARWAGAEALPALVFSWVDLAGTVVEQVRPAVPVADHKYLWPFGVAPVLGVIGKYRRKAPKVVLVEGTKQSRAVRRYIDDTWNVVALGGCSSWTTDGVPVADLAEHLGGREAVVLFDADLDRNRSVWDAAAKLRDTAASYGALSIRFASAPGRGSTGIDDVLGTLPPAKRSGVLTRLLAGATKRLPARPSPKSAPPPPGVIDVRGDRRKVAVEVVEALVSHLDGYLHGTELAELEGTELRPLDDDRLTNVCHMHTKPVIIAGPRVDPSVYDASTYRIIRDEARQRFRPLDRLARAPFLRLDGSVCSELGYDLDTRTLLLDNLDITVPEEPTDLEIRRAVKLLLVEWLGDFPFRDAGSRAGALALVLTPFVRSSFPVVPLAVLDGAHAGVGKGLLAEVVSLVATGRPSRPTRVGSSEDEALKAVHSAMRTGDDFVFLDEAHELGGEALASALTAPIFNARILGHSKMGAYLNTATWIAAGNRVRLLGDVYRRAYRVALYPSTADHENRGGYSHPELAEWTRQHRGELVAAALTLCRGWFARGRPEEASPAFHFGSFEQWQHTLGGILETAGVDGFLSNVLEWRDVAAPDRGAWRIHLLDLASRFGTGPRRTFSTRAVRDAIHAQEVSDPFEERSDAPDLADAHRYNLALGKLYGSRKDVLHESGATLRKAGTVGHGKQVSWFIEKPEGTEVTPLLPCGGTDSLITHTLTPGSDSRDPSVPSEEVFDLETASADRLWSDGPDFVRVSVTEGEKRLPDTSGRIVAHNGFGFDFLVLARHHGLDLVAAADEGRLWDTMVQGTLDDPISAGFKTARVPRHFSLDAMAERLGGPRKTTTWKELAKKHGGPDRIPLDELELYCRGDVAATRAIYEARSSSADYAAREMRVLGRLAAGITFEGFRVDLELLRFRLDEGQATTDRVTKALSERYGLPTVRADGKASARPFATQEGKEALRRAFKALGTDPDSWPRECRTPKGEPSFASSSLRFVADHFEGEVAELARTIAEGNGVRTVYQTIRDNLHGDRVHPSVFPAQASGRFSVTRPGLTVMGKRGGRHHEREVFIPDLGHELLCADFDQIDARAVAAHSQDPAYLELFEPGRDSHEEVAELVWGIRDGKHGPYRNRAKAIGHGWNYGMGPTRIAQETGVELSEAERFDMTMRARFPRLVEWKKEVVEIGRSGRDLDNGFGRRLRCDPDRAYTQAPALMGQSAARDIIAEAVLRLPARVVRMIRAIVHDELVFSIPVGVKDEVRGEIVEAMSFEWRPPGAALSVPVTASTDGPAASWGDVYS